MTSRKQESVDIEDRVDDDRVRALARAAGLTLEEARVGALTALLGAWLPAANELSRIMRGPEHREVVPGTVFAHPAPEPRK